MLQYIRRAFDAYKRNLLTIIGAVLALLLIAGALAAVGLLPIGFTVLETISGGVVDTSALISAIFQSTSSLAFAAIFLIAAGIAAVSLSAGIVKVYANALAGKANVRAMFSVAREKWLTAVGAMLIMIFVLGAVAAAASLIGLSLGLFGAVLTPAVILIVSIFFIYVNQSIVLSNLRALQAVQNSISFAKKNFIPTLGLLVIFVGISTILNYSVNYLNMSFVQLLATIVNIFLIGPLSVLSYTALYLGGRAEARRPARTGARKKKGKKR